MTAQLDSVDVFPLDAFCADLCQLMVDTTFALTAVARDVDGNELTGLAFTWSSSDETIATVDGNGLVTGHHVGEVLITAATGGVMGSKALQVIPPRAERVVVTPADPTIDENGTQQFTATAYDADDHVIPDLAVQWQSGNVSVATIDGNGLATGTGGGRTLIIATVGFAQTGFTSITVRGIDPPPPAWAVAGFSTGATHTCALLSSGDSYCWGWNFFGQLGTGSQGSDMDFFPAPLPVVTNQSFSVVTAGQYHTCALDQGRAFCWGVNDSGQLGTDAAIGEVGGHTTPTQVLGGRVFTTVSAGGSHTCGLLADGQAFCWGGNFAGQIGNNTTENAPVPTPVTTSLRFSTIVTGLNATCALTSAEGRAYCWGDEGQGALGNGGTQDGMLQKVPVPVDTTERFTALHMSSSHACALTSAGEVWCWGRNDSGQLGDGSTSTRGTPVKVDAVPMSAVAVGAHVSCALDADGHAWCWGNNDFGYLGTGNLESSTSPVRVASDLAFEKIDADAAHTCAATRTTHELWCWGSGYYGALGTGDLDVVGAFPVSVRAPPP